MTVTFGRTMPVLVPVLHLLAFLAIAMRVCVSVDVLQSNRFASVPVHIAD